MLEDFPPLGRSLAFRPASPKGSGPGKTGHVYKIAKFVSVMEAVGMAGALMAATPITVTQTVNASQFITTQQQSRNGPGTSTFIGTVSTTGPTLVPISQFDTNTGILVGARMSVTLPYTMSVSATGTIPPSGSGRTVDVTSGITGTVTIGGTSISTTSFAASPNCNSGTALTCPATTPPAPPARLPAPPPLPATIWSTLQEPARVRSISPRR